MFGWVGFYWKRKYEELYDEYENYKKNTAKITSGLIEDLKRELAYWKRVVLEQDRV